MKCMKMFAFASNYCIHICVENPRLIDHQMRVINTPPDQTNPLLFSPVAINIYVDITSSNQVFHQEDSLLVIGIEL